MSSSLTGGANGGSSSSTPDSSLVIELGRKVSQATLWKAQRHIFETWGPSVWNSIGGHSVPYCHLAKSYSNLISATIREGIWVRI